MRAARVTTLIPALIAISGVALQVPLSGMALILLAV
ncbi:UNVERIFIED_ORG: hypothetical protein J2W85_000134 [Ensifer adhaerens]|nr:hypothetical protein [Ensifer adhaerens]